MDGFASVGSQGFQDPVKNSSLSLALQQMFCYNL